MSNKSLSIRPDGANRHRVVIKSKESTVYSEYSDSRVKPHIKKPIDKRKHP